MNNPIDFIFQMFGGQQNFNNKFNQFTRNLMNTGKMNQQQFEWCRKIANQITGKNY